MTSGENNLFHNASIVGKVRIYVCHCLPHTFIQAKRGLKNLACQMKDILQNKIVTMKGKK
jgi:hypothetical protein